MSNVAIVLLRKHEENNQVFMVKNKRYNPKCKDCLKHKTACKNHLLYGNPAGELERNESFMEAAKREFYEETGCELSDLEKCHIYKEHDTIIIITKLNQNIINEKIIDNDEIYETKWININEIMNFSLLGVCKRLYPKYIPIWEKILSKSDCILN